MTIGYVVGGFVIKFHLNYLDTEIVYILDHMTLDILPLGSTLMFLIYSLMPLLLLYTVVGGVSFILLVRRTRVLLITVSSGSLLIYNYWLGSRTTAVLFHPRTDLLPEAAGWGQQIRSRVKQNCCCPRSQSITVLFNTPSFFLQKNYSLFPLTYIH